MQGVLNSQSAAGTTAVPTERPMPAAAKSPTTHSDTRPRSSPGRPSTGPVDAFPGSASGSAVLGASTPSALSSAAAPLNGQEDYRPEEQAVIIKDYLFPSIMSPCIELGQMVTPAGYKLYLDGLVRESGVQDDPFAVMLAQQLALMHFRVADLHYKSATATGIAEIEAYAAAAARLEAEFRRGVLAMATYRATRHGGAAARQGSPGAMPSTKE
jgi:hypothetical protein